MKTELRDFNILKQLLSGFGGYALVLFIVMIAVACAEAFGLSLFLPLFSGLIGQKNNFGKMDQIFFFLNYFQPENKILVLLTVLIVVFFLKSLLLILHSGMSAHFAMNLREKWSDKILASYLGAEYIDVLNEKHGVMFHNTTIEPFRVSKSIILLLQILSKLIMAVAIFVMLLFVNWQATMIITALGIIIMLGVKNITFNYSLRFGKERLDINQEESTIASESVVAIKEIKMLGKEEWYRSALAKKMRKFTKVQTRFSVFSQLPDNLLEIVFIIFISAAIFYIGFSHELSLKELLPILGFYIIVGQKLFKYGTLIISQRMSFTSALPSLRLIRDLIYRNVPKENLEKGIPFRKINSDIIIKDLCFSYDHSRSVLKNFNMKIPMNKMTALVGPSGSGKSTIADILMRLLTPESGQIRINGKDILDFKLSSWRDKIGYVSQEPFLFNISIRENILLAKQEASDRVVEEAAKTANIHDFIMTLEKGYDTLVGDRGVKLSGGQRQRIVIARAVVRNPELIIFDEATSALDTKAEAEVQKSINNLIGDKTILVIAHRLSTIEKAHIIYDLGKLNHG